MISYCHCYHFPLHMILNHSAMCKCIYENKGDFSFSCLARASIAERVARGRVVIRQVR